MDAKNSADLELQVMKPKECQWWDMYVNNYLMLEDSSMQAKFWVRFRIPYSNYLELLQWIRDDTHFARWCGAKLNNKMSSPIELLVLGSLCNVAKPLSACPCQMDLFSTFLVVTSSSASGQIHPSLPEIPIDNGQPPPPHRSRPAILCINCRATKEGSVTATLPSL